MKIRSYFLSLAIVAVATPAGAGEVTGNGDPTGMWGHAVSECAFSGLNDHDGDPRDPGAHTQNYGTLVQLGIFNPQDADPTAPGFPPIPGYSCNPNRGNEGPFFPEED